MTCWPNGTKKQPRLSSPYGPRKGGAFPFHYGADFTGVGDVHAVEGGTVTLAKYWNDNAGNTVAVDLPGKIDGATVTLVYMHLSRIDVKRGQKISAGQVIGRAGKTGNATGVCVHVEVRFWRAGKMTTVDPVPWVKGRLTAAPRYPLPAGSYFGPRYPLSNKQSVSGFFGHRDDLRRWQQRMHDRGWTINVDGLYGPQTGNVAAAFQHEKGLAVDRIIGPKTWAAAWTEPVT